MWKDVAGFEKFYEVSDKGVVRNKKTLKELKPKQDRAGYCSVTLCNGNTQKQTMIHRIVALAYLEAIDGKPCVNHIDGNKQNNSTFNLEWCTYKENTQHAIKNGLFNPAYDRHGNKHPNVKVTEKIIREIKHFLNSGGTQSEARKKFNLSTGTISNIANNKTFLGVVM